MNETPFTAHYDNKETMLKNFKGNLVWNMILYLFGLVSILSPPIDYLRTGNSNSLYLLIILGPLGLMFLYIAIEKSKSRTIPNRLSTMDITKSEMFFSLFFRPKHREKHTNLTIKRENIQNLTIGWEQRSLHGELPYETIQKHEDIKRVDFVMYLIEEQFQRKIIHAIPLDAYDDHAEIIYLLQSSGIPIFYTNHIFKYENELDYKQFLLQDAQVISFQLSRTESWFNRLTYSIDAWHDAFPKAK